MAFLQYGEDREDNIALVGIGFRLVSSPLFIQFFYFQNAKGEFVRHFVYLYLQEAAPLSSFKFDYVTY